MNLTRLERLQKRAIELHEALRVEQKKRIATLQETVSLLRETLANQACIHDVESRLWCFLLFVVQAGVKP